MGWLKESSVCLRFYGDDLIPSEVTETLGSEPTIGAAMGEVFLGSGGIARVAHTGMWRLEQSRRKPGDLNPQIAEIFASLSDDLAIWKGLTSRFNSDLFCGLWLDGFNSGQPLESDTIRMIADRSLKLDLDIYGDPDLEAD